MKKIIILIFVFAFLTVSVICESVDSLINKGIESYQSDELSKAKDYFQEAIKVSSYSGDAYYYLGLIFMEEGDLSSAELNLKKALKIDPKWSAAYEKLGSLYNDQGDFSEAQDMFEKAIKFNPDSEGALKFFGDKAYQRGDFEKAKNYYFKLKDLSESDPEITKKLGFIAISENDYHKALSYFSQYSGLFPFNKDISNRVFLLKLALDKSKEAADIEKAKKLLYSGDLSEENVKDIFKKEIAETSENNVNQNIPRRIDDNKDSSNIGKILLWVFILGVIIAGVVVGYLVFIGRKNKESQEQDVPKKMKIKKIDSNKDISELKSLLVEAQTLNDTDAIKKLVKIICEKEETAENFIKAGKAIKEIGDIENSISYYEKALNHLKGDEYLDVLLLLMALSLDISKPEKALTYFTRIKSMRSPNIHLLIQKIQDFPKNLYKDKNLFSQIIDFIEEKGDHAKVISILEKFIEHSDEESDIHDIRIKLVEILKIENLNRKAANIYEDMIREHPRNLNLYVGLVEAYLKYKESQKACDYIEKGLRGFPDQKDTFINICLDNMNSLRSDRNMFLKVLEVFSQDDDLKKDTKVLFQNFIEEFNDEEANKNFYDFLMKAGFELESFELLDDFLKRGWLKYATRFLDDLNNYLKREPDDLPQIKRMATILSNLGRNAEAFILYKKVFEFEPANPDILFNLYKISGVLNREEDIVFYGKKLLFFKETLSEAIKLLNIDPNSNKELEELEIDMLIALENKDEAVKKLRYLEIKNQSDKSIKEKFAKVLKDIDPKESLEKYKILLKLDPTKGEYWESVADNFLNLGKVKQAIKAFKKMIELPVIEEMKVKAVKTTINNGFFDIGLKFLARFDSDSIKKDELKSELLSEKARFEYKYLNTFLKNKQAPEDMVNHLINGNNIMIPTTDFLRNTLPGLSDFEIKVEIIERYLYMGAYDEGIEMAQNILNIKENWKTRFLLGRLFLEKGLVEIAFREFSKVDWDNADLKIELKFERMYEIAQLFEERNMEKEAIHFYREIFSRDVNYRDVREKIENLDNKLLMSRTIDETTGLSLEIRRRYSDIKELGKGGMGIVYRATDKKLGRKVALKVMLSEFVNNNKAVERFLREAKAIATLNHPYIVSVFDVSSEKNVYIAMEYVEGENLKTILHRVKRLTTDKIVKYGMKICEALSFAHEHSVIHRDIKPENIMIDPKDNVRIMDFGLARIEDGERLGGDVMGTPFFMSPEQIRGDKVDNRTDIYSLGITLYNLATGKLPFEEGDVRQQHLSVDPKRPSLIIDGVSAKLEEIIMRCLEKNPANRFSSMEELKKELEKIKYL